MEEIIQKLQELIKQDGSLSEEKKKDYLEELENFRQIDDEDLKLILGSVLDRAQQDVNSLVRFLDEVLATKLSYVKDGISGLKKTIANREKILSSLKDF